MLMGFSNVQVQGNREKDGGHGRAANGAGEDGSFVEIAMKEEKSKAGSSKWGRDDFF